MSWRQWLFAKLNGTLSLTAIVPADRVMAAGALTGSPPVRPFVLYRMGGDTTRMQDADVPLLADNVVQVWVYDDPGSYARIEQYLDEMRKRLPGQVIGVPNAHACVWGGTSGELADDEFKCAVKFANLKLVGGLQ